MAFKLRSLAVLLAGLASVTSAKAEEMRANEARQFIAGRHFSYTCFEGTSGNGRIYADGSVAGYINVAGSSVRRYVVLPAGTLQVRGDQYCASLRGLPFAPCFNLNRTSNVSFRGAISGLRFAYCDFQRGSARADIARPGRALRIHAASAGAE